MAVLVFISQSAFASRVRVRVRVLVLRAKYHTNYIVRIV